ncbi:MAG: DUF1636 domain-containing protein [Rhodoplanes sp.]|nr:DUF1636 domain-containing protein [Rhodoplanes sp.]
MPHESTPSPSGAALGAATLFVCITCKHAGDDEALPRAGRRLHEALCDAQRRDGATPSVRIVPVECLSNCNRACSIALAGDGRWTYVHGDLAPDAADDILLGAARYAATADGLVPWRERPERLRRGTVARVPPLPLPLPLPSPGGGGSGVRAADDRGGEKPQRPASPITPSRRTSSADLPVAAKPRHPGGGEKGAQPTTAPAAQEP